MFDVSFLKSAYVFGLFWKQPPTQVKTFDNQLKNESVKKEDAEFCGENLIVRKLKNVCFIQWPSAGEHFFELTKEF